MDTTLPKLCRLSKVKIYDFRKSKCITESRFPKVKMYHRKSTFGSQNVSPEVDFRKSKNITGNRQFPKVKNFKNICFLTLIVFSVYYLLYYLSFMYSYFLISILKKY